MAFSIAVLSGDGIGPEVVGKAFWHDFVLGYGDIGGVAMDNHGHPLPGSTLDLCKGSHAVTSDVFELLI